MATTVLQHLRLHRTFTFPAHREGQRFFDFLKCMNTISGILNDRNDLTTSEIAQIVHFPRARGKYRRSRG